MTHSYKDLDSNMKPLSDISNYTIEDGDPDPRGYTVVSGDGTDIGRVEDLIVDTSEMKVRYLVVELNDASIASADRSILLPAEQADVRTDRNQVVAASYTGTGSAQSYTRTGASAGTGDVAGRTTGHDRTLTRSEEELHVGKRQVERGEARVSKHVETEHVSQPVTRRHEEVVIERRPVEAGARAHANISDDEIRVPLMEEEVVVEKRPVVKEELVIGKRVVEERDTVEADVRREEFEIDQPGDASSRTRGRSDDR